MRMIGAAALSPVERRHQGTQLPHFLPQFTHIAMRLAGTSVPSLPMKPAAMWR
jgi:hypothetical protein